MPFGKEGRWLKTSPAAVQHLLGGWQLTGITAMMSGLPFSPGYLTNVANIANAGSYRPNRVCNGNLPRDQRSIDRWFDTSCFQSSATYTFGNSGRNVLLNPGTINFDLSLKKNFALGERFRLSWRSEFFNALNTPHFLGQQYLSSTNFNQVGGAQAGRLTVAGDPVVPRLEEVG